MFKRLIKVGIVVVIILVVCNMVDIGSIIEQISSWNLLDKAKDTVSNIGEMIGTVSGSNIIK